MSNKDKLSITFLYPSRRVGGAQLLFVRLAVELSKYDDLLVNVVDFSDGYLRSQLTSFDRITILPYIKGIVKISNETVLVTPLSNMADLKYIVNGDFTIIKVLFWSIHPSNLDFVFNANGRKWFGDKKKLKEFIKNISDAGNLIYMDEANFLAVNEILSINKKPEYLQIPIEINNYITSSVNIEHEKLNIAWLGRVSYDKIFSIKKIVDEIKSLEDRDSVIFHVIGTGEKYNELELYLKESGINYVLPGILVKNELSEYMTNNIQLGVAMGTSCMEFAARKIPVFLIDYSEEKFPNEIKYNWLFETQNYTLGSHVNSATYRNHKFKELINQFNIDKSIGEKCYRYIENNHNINNVALKLIFLCKKLKPIENLEFDIIQKILNPLFYNTIYSFYRRIRRF